MGKHLLVGHPLIGHAFGAPLAKPDAVPPAVAFESVDAAGFGHAEPGRFYIYNCGISVFYNSVGILKEF